MKPVHFVVIAALAGIVSAASAQFVKGNEAVHRLADGSERVETPPTARALLAPPCPAARDGCAGGGWLMVETAAGLMECTEIYALPGTCRASTYGTEKRSRVWIVKRGGQWQQCQYPDLASRCVSTKSPAISAVQ